MAVFISQFENTTPLGAGSWTSNDVLTDRSAVVGVLVSSDNNLTLNFNWSPDGITTVLTESQAITGGTPAEHFRPIKAKYLNIELTNGGVNTSLNVSGFFFNSESVMLAIRNLGTGTHVGNLNKLGLRTLKSSDASITISNTADEIDLISASSGSSVVALNDNVQVTEAPAGQFNVGVGRDTANTLNLGWNTPLPASGTYAVNLGYGRGTGDNSISIGAGATGAGCPTTTGGIFIGSGSATVGAVPNNSIAIGTTSCFNAVTGVNEVLAIGYNSYYAPNISSKGGNTAIGHKSLNCSSVGVTGGLITTTAVGYQALYNITPVVDAIQENTAIGRNAFNGAKLGLYNTAVGGNAGVNMISANQLGYNTIIGGSCCTNSTINDEVTVIGSLAGGSSKTIGNRSTIIGKSAGSSTGSASNTILLGYNSGTGTMATYEICIGSSCASSNVSGRLSFGSSMETPVTISNSSIESPTKLISMDWNGVNYRIPVLSSTATDLKLTNNYVSPLGELAYEDYATGTTITIGATSTKYIINPADTLNTNSSSGAVAYFTNPSNGRLTYVGAITQKFNTSVSVSCVSSGGSGKLWEFELRKNGTKVTNSAYRESSPGTSEFPVSFHIIIELATNDYIEVFVSNETDTSNLLVENFNLVAMGTIAS